MGTDDFEIKVSAAGSTFHTALQANAASGQVHFPQGATGLAPTAFGNGALLTVDYASARGLDLVTNRTGMLGNTYNYPAQFSYDPIITPNLPASFSLAGYYPGAVAMSEFLAIDPNQVWRVSSFRRKTQSVYGTAMFRSGSPGNRRVPSHAL